MIVLVQANVVSIGLGEKNEALRKLPIRLIEMNSSKQAAGTLKRDEVDSVISKLSDENSDNAGFLKKLKAAKPNIPTIVFVQSGHPEQEIAARSLGASAVLTDEASDEMFQDTVANVLDLRNVISIKTITPAEKEKRQEFKQSSAKVRSIKARTNRR